MLITFTVEADISHVTGKFVGRDAIEEELLSELEGADPGSLCVEDSEYEVDNWVVLVNEPEPQRRSR